MNEFFTDILESLGNERLKRDVTIAATRLLKRSLSLPDDEPQINDSLEFTAETLELVVLDLADRVDIETQLNDLEVFSEKAFQLWRVLPLPSPPIDAAVRLVKISCLGVLADRGSDVSRFLKNNSWPDLPINSDVWGERVKVTIFDIWLRLLRKDGWHDFECVHQHILSLKDNQNQYEKEYFNQIDKSERKTAVLEVVAYYHLSKAAETFAKFALQGSVDGYYDIREKLDSSFDVVIQTCNQARLIELENIVRLLIPAVKHLVKNSIWTVTRAANSKVIRFVEQVVNNRHKPIFEMLPPQRRALREAGLLGSGYRSVVVNLPTSSGKTLIAQFRILQALNQFEREQGWVAYLVPTRALVNEIFTRLRNDFMPLGINVERVTPVLEIDSIEVDVLKEKDPNNQFRVLVSTPEKFDLMLRGGWEKKVGRPLTLVVVDEAHNLSQKERGLKLELLLATINRECRFSQFLLLTPFIPNAIEIAKWLSPDNHTQMELGVSWLPNDKAVVTSKPIQNNKRSYTLELETLHTNKETIEIPEKFILGEENPINLSWSKISSSNNLVAAATAHLLRKRGSLIVIAQQARYTWIIAKNLQEASSPMPSISEDIKIVQRFLVEEFGENFPLTHLLEYGIGVHHSGLSDEARILVEWLFKKNAINVMVATTTMAQGVNLPISSVVLASHQYPYGQDMPPEDFWNLAGRAGRADQGDVGIIALAANNENKVNVLKEFVTKNVTHLNSTLINMIKAVEKEGQLLELHSLYNQPEWSSFLQYLAHTYRQINNNEMFASQIEQILRGTLGFQNLRREYPDLAVQLVFRVREYGTRISNKPLSLVDNTGFSWESINKTLFQLHKEGINQEAWDKDVLFEKGNTSFEKLIKIMQDIPELRKNIEEVRDKASTGGKSRIAEIISDWVNGATIEEIAEEYFMETTGRARDSTDATTTCCQTLFRKLIPATSWGLAALQTLTFREELEKLPETELQSLRNLPARIFYGVNSDDAITLRFLGVPRLASRPLAEEIKNRNGAFFNKSSLSLKRQELQRTDATFWRNAIGESGEDYYRIWKVLEGYQ